MDAKLKAALIRTAGAIPLAAAAIFLRLTVEQWTTLRAYFAFPFLAIVVAGLWMGTPAALLTGALTLGFSIWLWHAPELDATFTLLGVVAFALALITGRHRVAVLRERERSKAAQEHFRTMADGLPHPVWVYDNQGRLEFVNRTYREYFDVTEEDVRGMGWHKLIHPDDLEVYSREYQQAVGDHRLFHTRVRVRRADGQWRWIESWARPRLAPSGELQGFVGVGPDITEQVEQERKLAQASAALARANFELDQFSCVASHDLKQPLRGMSQLVGFILEDDRAALSPASVERLNRIEGLARHLMAMIDGLLVFARSGGKFRSQPCMLDDIARRAVDSLRETIQEAGAEVTILPGLPVVPGDPSLLERALCNLIANGLKYNEAPTPCVEVGWTEGELFVRDNGIGIEPSQHHRIFVLFSRLGGKKTVEGVGLGLPFVKRIAEAHGGSVRVESAPGQGSTFYLRLPIVQAPARKAA